MLRIYVPLVLAVLLLYFGIICYYVPKYEINEDNKLFKYRPSKDNILIRLKLFKYDWKFNYLLLIPYLISLVIFVSVLIIYMLYLFGIKYIKILLLSNLFNIFLFIFVFMLIIYDTILKEIINYYNGKSKD